MKKYIDFNVDDLKKIDGIKLSDYRILNVELLPKWEVTTIEETTPYLDEAGNITGVTSRIVKTSTITLTPKESVNDNAENRRKEIKSTSKEKGS